MRYLLALGGALALAGCASSERVTLLAPVQESKIANNEVGAIAVLHGGTETVIDMANEQAGLRGERSPRVRQLAETDPRYTDIMRGLPLGSASENFEFAVGQNQLPDQELARLKSFLERYIESYTAYYADIPEDQRPAFHVIIAGFSDSSGEAAVSDADLERINTDLSTRRADTVRGQVIALVREAGIPIRPDEIDSQGNGHFAAMRKHNGARVVDQDFRIVSVTVR